MSSGLYETLQFYPVLAGKPMQWPFYMCTVSEKRATLSQMVTP